MSVPLVKIFGEGITSTWVSSLMYFGAGFAMVVLSCALRISGKRDVLGGLPLGMRQAPLLILMVGLNAASAIALMAGISLTGASAASLLGNLEVVATAVFAWLLFREPIGRRMAAAVAAIIASGFLLSWNGDVAALSPGALLIILACVLWGLENNCTRALSTYDVISVTRIKGLFTGIASAVIAVVAGPAAMLAPDFWPSAAQLWMLFGIGAVSYGVSIALYIWAQRYIGAARTGNLYSIAPFVGVMLSWAAFGMDARWQFWIALGLSGMGVMLTAADVSKGPVSNEAGEAA